MNNSLEIIVEELRENNRHQRTLIQEIQSQNQSLLLGQQSQNFEITLVKKDYVILIEKHNNLDSKVQDICCTLNNLVNQQENSKIIQDTQKDTKQSIKALLFTLLGMLSGLVLFALDAAGKFKGLFK